MTPDPQSAVPAVPGDSEGPVAPVAPVDWVTARPLRAVEILLRILRFPRLFVEHRDLISTSVKRELEARFKGTVLGWAWPLVQPLFLFTVYYFIFTELLQFKIPNLPEDKKAAMGVFMFVGITAWATIAETLTRGTNSIVENGNLIKKLAFPSEVLPLNLTQSALREGRLVEVMPDFRGRELILHAVQPPGHLPVPKTRALIDFLTEHFGPRTQRNGGGRQDNAAKLRDRRLGPRFT